MVNSINTNASIATYYNPIKTETSKNSESGIKEEIIEWLNDDDKYCTDGIDDGNISLNETIESIGKGIFGIVKTAIKHPIATAATVAGSAILTVATGGAILPVLVSAGVATGCVQIGKGVYNAITAESDAEAKSAYENIGNGIFSLAASSLGAKTALKSASTAGVTSAENANNLNTFQSIV